MSRKRCPHGARRGCPECAPDPGPPKLRAINIGGTVPYDDTCPSCTFPIYGSKGDHRPHKTATMSDGTVWHQGCANRYLA